MPDMMIFDEKKDENDYLADKAKDVNAYVSDTRLDVAQFTNSKEASDSVKGNGGNDMAVTALSENDDTEVAEGVRAANRDAEIMIVADETVSPKKYLTPKIKASSLLLRPYDDEECSETMKEFMRDCYAGSDKDSKKIVIGRRGRKQAVSVSDIYYVEARGRKIFFRLRNTEMSEYAVLEDVLKDIGDSFIRCHRSFAFNIGYFDSVKLSENQIKLLHGFSVPLSRTYKRSIKELVRKLSDGSALRGDVR